MQSRSNGTVRAVLPYSPRAVLAETEFGPAIAYSALVGDVAVGDSVLLNRTSNVLGLGTGGYDFVIAVINQPPSADSTERGHIIKLRYTPSQLSVETLEENPELFNLWDRLLDGVPVIVGQLHSQIAHAAAAVKAAGKRAVYVMTDTASLAAPMSKLLCDLRHHDVLSASITCGNAFGGDYETVTIHSALLAARYWLKADVIIVCQGPGNAGTGTKYGFSGIEQASWLDTTVALGGMPIAVLRWSDADPRDRHRGTSHHSRTVLHLVRSACTIPIPAGMILDNIDRRHTIIEMSVQQSSFDLLERLGIRVTTMGRDTQSERRFFETAAVAGQYAASSGV